MFDLISVFSPFFLKTETNTNNNENNQNLVPIFYINHEDVQSLPKEYILVADDSTICRRMICKVLERFGFETEGIFDQKITAPFTF